MKKSVFQKVLLLLFCGGLACSSSTAQSNTSLIDQLKATGLPLVNITTVNGELPTCEKIDTAPEGCMGSTIVNATKVPGRIVITLGDSVLYDSGEYAENVSGMKIKIRGNTSAYRTHPSYKIKLQKKANLLKGSGSKKDKEWALLNSNTSANLRTVMGKQIALLCGIEWEPQDCYVNLVFNGKYCGDYLLSELVKRSEGRCNVAETGYVIECDPYWWSEDKGEFSFFHTTHLPYSMAYTFKYPDAEVMTQEQWTYIRDVVYDFEDKMFNGEPIEEVFDISTMASWFLAHDISGSWDGCGSNIFITKYDNTPNSKLKMGPLWDFDLDYSKEGWASVHEIPEFYGIPFFSRYETVMAYNDRWQQVRPLIEARVEAVLDSMRTNWAEAIDASRTILKDSVSKHEPTFAEKEQEVREWFAQRLPWLDEAIANLVSDVTAVDNVEVGTLRTASVVAYSTSGVLLYQGSEAQFNQWRKQQKNYTGIAIVRYTSTSGRLGKTEKLVL